MSVITITRSGNPRIVSLYIGVVILFLYLAGGLAWRQLVQAESFSEMEQQQSLRRILIPAPRGQILDREGQVLVDNRPRLGAVVYLNHLRPEFRRSYLSLVRELREREIDFSRQELQVEARLAVTQAYADEVAAIIGRPLEINRSEMDRHFRQNLLLPFPIAQDLTPEEFSRLVEQIPPSSDIQLFVDSERYYPFGEAACHVLGYCTVGIETPEQDLPGQGLTTFSRLGLVGRSGIERLMDETLRGTPGTEILVVDPSGFQFEHRLRKEPLRGNPVRLTLDIDLQLAAEQALGDRVGAVVVMKVQTGEVLALVSRPGFDLNDLSPRITHQVWQEIQEQQAELNRAVRGFYPPGSTFKLITALAGLASGSIDPFDTLSDCRGSHRVGDRNFPCHNRSGHGPVDLSDSLCISCNVFYYEHGVRTGVDQISSFSRLMGLDRPTGIELTEEGSHMLVPNRDWKRRSQGEPWYPGDTANFSIGQGYLLLSPLQVAAFTASLARGETTTQPTLLMHGDRPPAPIHSDPLPISPEALRVVHEGMHRATTEGTARLARIPDIPIAGKTGTAQIRPRGVPLQLAWFTGFAPLENPEIVVTVMIEGTDPRETLSGGLASGPVARTLFRNYFENKFAREQQSPRTASSP